MLDLTGRWLIPGLVDTHTHLPGGEAALPYLEEMVAFGVTAAGDPASPRVVLRERIESGALVAPTLRVAGALIDAKESIWSFAARVSTEAETRETVRRQVAEKVDFIKLCGPLRGLDHRTDPTRHAPGGR